MFGSTAMYELQSKTKYRTVLWWLTGYVERDDRKNVGGDRLAWN